MSLLYNWHMKKAYGYYFKWIQCQNILYQTFCHIAGNFLIIKSCTSKKSCYLELYNMP